MRFFVEQLTFGLTNGAIFALIALGYTMVYGIIELINFAHGDIFTVGGFFGLTVILTPPTVHWVPGSRSGKWTVTAPRQM